MSGEACLSVPTIALLTPIAAALVAALVAMWRQGEKSHEREIDNCNELLAGANERLNQGVLAGAAAKAALGVQSRGRRA